jgi:hypothetical protein
MKSARIFKTAVLTTDAAGLPQISEGICAEGSCYVHKILQKEETRVKAIICEPQMGDIITAKVTETGKYITELELGPITVLVPHDIQRSPIRVDDIKKVMLLNVRFEYPEPMIRAFGRFVEIDKPSPPKVKSRCNRMRYKS